MRHIAHRLLTRRFALRAGGMGMMGLSLPGLLRAETVSVPHRPRAKSVIFLFQWGGPSQIDSFDMKPNAPEEYRSPYRPIATSVPGLPICELMPRLAAKMHHVSVVRTPHAYHEESQCSRILCPDRTGASCR